MNQKEKLQKTLRMRHMMMIAFGGSIGAGLFVGSGAIIQDTGPSAVLTALMAGILVILIMRMLGEMVVAKPSLGSFSDYAREALGNWAGFTVGWLYWYFWVIVIAVEAIAGATILQDWIFPNTPLWILNLILLLALTLTNLFSVKAYGEFEYWFSLIKVVTITLFLLVGGAYVLGLLPGTTMNFSNLTTHGGFAPVGTGAVFVAIATIIFSFVGSEIVTIAAAESDESEKAVVKAVNSVIIRILMFYVGSVFLIVTIIPWNDDVALKNPYVNALKVIGIPGADVIMNLVVVTAVLSCLNSGLYTASRMLFALGNKGDAPKWMLNVTKRGVPLKAILTCTIFGFLSVIMSFISPDTVFQFLLNSSGAIALFVYLLIAISQLILRKKIENEMPHRLKFRMWGYPYVTIASIIAITMIIGSMGFNSETQSQLVLSIFSVIVVVILYIIKTNVTRKKAINSNIVEDDISKIK
ncbi:amino acid permease [Priestia endophytica]|uniref:Gamma-aminobutyrate:proton symporter, AAT family n=1 Tax=Priestia endophytica DSM 13796 TaxID=1121089 RepID=A0A1I6BXY7_9BACI|nr:amino acid permease [Priestia endophytica]KYG33080.1 GABA permease [Priestia endophytica]MBG9813315.1 GABA permease [Priestia endophytica]SFQ85747.1 gamma-aminobutyrate:proton symporter, AAT family [Priestia endophytica DSM 13796]